MFAWLTLVAALSAGDAIPPTAVPASRAAHVVAILPVRDEMDAIGMEGLSERVAMAQAAGADAVVLAFDTPGGELLSTLELCRRIKSEYPANTVAWIRPRAFSAGTITALACREIVVTPDAVFGDAAPISVSPMGGLQALPPAERAKLQAPLVSEVSDSARRRGHDERLCRAFVSAEDALWLLEDAQRGERYIVDAAEYRGVFGEDPPNSATLLQNAPRAPMVTVMPWIKDALRRAMGDASTSAPGPETGSGRPSLTPDDRDRLRLVSMIDTPDELLTLRADEALALGMAKAPIADEAALRAFFGAERSFTLEARWSEHVARFLTSWWMRMLLVVVIVACFAGEMLAPGLGAFSLAGLAAAALLIGGPLLAGLAEWWPAVALLAGLALVAIEILAVPGTFIAGTIGVVAFAAGTIGLFVVSDPSLDPTHGIVQGVVTLVVAIATAVGVGWWMGRQGGGSFGGAVLQAQLADAPSGAELPTAGAEGLAHSDLRPIGRVDIGGRIADARATGWVARGTRIRVVRVDGNELIVEAIS